ncbi:hypothetical protein N7452_009616 [Penicillium brevicompactum]|uniref:Uncharacterized protein n=1 Tax=Penicillium brevicompactum TaxID=5074 RepID=A0A9W9UAE9_PENBR|nr:hypothetical protein N7452_009616 [Penicillium brevicompactum]
MSPPVVNFPTLQPAIVWKVNAGAAHQVDFVDKSIKETPTGTIETVEGFEPRFTGKIDFGADWLSFDPDQKHARIDMKAIATTDDGKKISFGYTGTIELNEAIMKIFSQAPDSVSVPFGSSVGAHSFFSGDPSLKELENMTLVGNGRLLVDPETRVISVESRISRVYAATGFD